MRSPTAKYRVDEFEDKDVWNRGSQDEAATPTWYISVAGPGKSAVTHTGHTWRSFEIVTNEP